jgi:ankyrin repeat protein
MLLAGCGRESGRSGAQGVEEERTELGELPQEPDGSERTDSRPPAGPQPKETETEYDLLVAIQLDDLDRVKSLLDESPQFADDFQDESPLRTAASLGRLEICRYLIEQYRVDVDDFERRLGYPIIKEALAYPDIVRLLIDSGADLQTRITYRGNGTGIWIIGDDATALHFAARDGVPETIKLLIDNGVDIFATAHYLWDENVKQTALEVAAIFGRADNAKAILNHAKFDEADQRLRRRLLDKCLWVGASPILRPRGADRPELIRALLKKGADPNASEDGVSAIQIAAREINPGRHEENREIRKMIAILVEHGAIVDLFSAVAIGDEKQVDRLLKQDPETANSRGPDGYPALHFAVGMNNQNVVQQLLKAGCDVDIRNTSDRQGYRAETALGNAAFWGRYEIAELLISAGADVNALTERRSTSLHSAARMGSVRVVRLLIENGANINAQDKDGKTPLDWCRSSDPHNADETEKVLREYHKKVPMR